MTSGRIVISSLLALLSGSTALAAEWTVGPEGTFASIPAALAKVASGDVIRVGPGVYDGNLVLDKPVQLIGEGRAILRGAERGSVVTVNAPRSVIRGFRIEKSGGSLIDEDSGILLRSDGNQVIDNELDDILFGIYFYRANENVVRHNRVHGRTRIESGERGAGIHLYDCLRNTIEDNVISDTRDGMYLQNASESVIRRNIVTGVRYGLHYMYSNDNVFEDNMFVDNVAGAAIMYSQRIQLRRNRFAHNRGFSSFGILFQDSTDLAIKDNVIADNATGIFMEALRSSTFQHNLIAGNDTAIQMFSSVEQNEFFENNFIANLAPIRLIGRSTTTRWSRGNRGNYWSEYDGYDLDGDGIGDVPHRIRNLYERLEGDYPRLRVYFYSPAAQALVAAERIFPIVRFGDDQDAHPLMKPLRLAVPLAATRPSYKPALAIVICPLLAGIALLARKRRSQ